MYGASIGRAWALSVEVQEQPEDDSKSEIGAAISAGSEGALESVKLKGS